MSFSIQHAPVTASVRDAWRARQQKSDSWNLLLDKLSFQPTASVPDDRKESPKHNALIKIRDTYAAAKAALDNFAQRHAQFLARLSLQQGPRFRRVTLVNSSRLLLHLGRASALENVGIYCDRTTGLPMIPGSAVKGVLSTWACWEGNLSRDELTTARSALGSYQVDVFGANPAPGSSSGDAAGKVIFLGGCPQGAPGLELDIVTPHPLDGRGRITPSPFLAVRAGTPWDFTILLSSRVAQAEVAQLIEKTTTWMHDCLTQAGLGAKTASGYGNFRQLNEVERQIDERRFAALLREITESAALEQMSPEEKAFHDFKTGVRDWTVLARDILSKSGAEQGFILRYFRSPEGQAAIKGWPKNEKATKRLDALKQAGL